MDGAIIENKTMPMETKNARKILLIMLLFILASMQAKTQIVYTDINPDTTIFVPNVPYNVDSSNSFIFDLNIDGINDFGFVAKNYFIQYGQPYGQLLDIGSLWSICRVAGGCSDGGIRNDIFFNDSINAEDIWDINQHIRLALSTLGWGCDIPIGDTYFGLKLKVNSDSLYGWVRCSATYNSITIKDYAYNTTPDMYILAGQTSLNTLNTDNNINIFENNNNLNINLTGFAQPEGTIKMYNNLGILIKSVLINGSHNTISLSGMAAGIYVVQVQTPLGITNNQIFLQGN